MDKHPYKLPKYKKYKIYYPYRCPNCYKILRIKIFVKDNIIKYNCQCKKNWMISYNICAQNHSIIRKPKKLDSNLNLRCSRCQQTNNDQFKFLKKCLICKKVFCLRSNCLNKHCHICPGGICTEEHSNDYFIYLNKLDVTCDIHSKDFIAYSKTSDKDLCEECILSNYYHDIIYYKDILPKKREFIEKYNNFNNLSNKFVTFFPGERRKTNSRLIYFFHLREIIRNCYFNFSSYSQYNKYNFALISNVLENSDFITFNKDITPNLILNYKTAPTCFLNSSKYIFDFLKEKNKPKINFLIEEKTINKIYTSFPNNKYIIIIFEYCIQLYNSKTLELFYKKNGYLIKHKYNCEDNRLICYSEKQPSNILLLKINSKKNEVKEMSFCQYSYSDILLMKDSILFQFNDTDTINVYDDKDINTLKYKIRLKEFDSKILALDNYIVYIGFNSIISIDIKTMNEYVLLYESQIKYIKKIDKNHIIVNHGNCINYLINVPLNQVINVFKRNKFALLVSIVDKYLFIIKKEYIEIINVFTKKAKKYYDLISSDYKGIKEDNRFILAGNYLIHFWRYGIISINSF